MIGIQAMDTVGDVGPLRPTRFYGYVWNKDSTGAWNCYVEQTRQPSPYTHAANLKQAAVERPISN